MSDVKFRLKNNDTRSYGFAGRMCVAGSGNPTPVDAAKQVINGVPFRLPGLFEMTEDEMFKSWRGVLPVMRSMTPHGRPAVEIFVEGVNQPLTAEDMEGWAADYRGRKNLPQPKTPEEHVREVERAMNRPEDPIERQQRLDQEAQEGRLARTVTTAVLEVLRAMGIGGAQVQPALQTAPAASRGRNDEAPEQGSESAPPQRGRPRT